jgi:hypothetical protein
MSAGISFAVPAKEIEITPGVEKDGRREYTVRIRPSENHTYNDIVFNIIYQQEFRWENADGKVSRKTIEPVEFTYKRHDVKFISDLDVFITFRVPVSKERLQKAYGERVFKKDCPITIPRIRISAVSDGKTVWKTELPSKGLHQLEKKEPEKAEK